MVSIWRASSAHFQRHIWKLAASLFHVMFAVDKNGTGSKVKVNVTSCGNPPNLLLIRNITFVIGPYNEYNVSFLSCVQLWFFTTWWAISNGSISTSFYYDACKLSEPWYSEKDLQILEELDNTLVGLIIARVVAFITLIASSTTPALALFSTGGINN